MEIKSVKMNIVLSGIKTMMSIAFPLITLPYASRILQVENLGKVSFTFSIISYFMLIASCGISTYAIREGARIRADREKFNEFANQIFTINIVSTIISYVSLFIVILLIPKLYNYRLLLFIQSITIIFTTIGVDWIYSIYEEYFYITLRTLISQLVAILLLFSLVKNEADYYLYAMVGVVSSVGANLFNFFHAKKYCNLKITQNIELKKHIKSILVIFSTSIATTIYVNSDIIMLGFMTTDTSVGLYSLSVKIYSIIKILIGAVFLVTLSRLSFYISNKREAEYLQLVTRMFNFLILLVFPIIVGLNVLCDQIILIISGDNYILANTSLHILSIAILFAVFASFYTNAICLPMKKEKYVLKATIIGASFNVVLNFFAIPIWQQNGAAMTTLISELIVLVMSMHYVKDIKYLISLKNVASNLLSAVIACISVVIVSIVLSHLISTMVFYTITTIICSCISYFLVLLMLKNKIAWECMIGIIKKVRM